ncbi:phosphorylated adapter RNA export protein [Dermacentor albipictus]|uniref:phosphorylated adapter RNA export protein n=1 Tax=Dermacentor albipictus TaxID=60249 RepID=UPI0038FCFEF5
MEASVANSVTRYRDDRPNSTSEDDSDDEETSWKRQATDKARNAVAKAGYDFSKCAALAGVPQQASPFRKKKVNNVWGAVLSEQLLMEDLGQVSVESSHMVNWKNDRHCESYDFTRKDLDTRPDPIEPDDLLDGDSATTHDVVDIQDSSSRGQKRSIMDRLGERACTRPSRSRSPKLRGAGRQRRSKSDSSKSSSSEADDEQVAEVAADIANRLEETNVELVGRVVQVLGVARSRKLLGMTEDIETTGGLLTRDKSRRRTPGGVFFFLVKANTSRDEANMVFGEEIRQRERMRRKYRKERSRMIREEHVALAAAAVPLSEATEERKDAEEPENLEDPVRPQEPDSGCVEVDMAAADDEDLEDGEIVD